MIKLRWLVIPAAAAAVPAFAQNDGAVDNFFGPQIGVFYPSGSKLRDALGSQWLSFGAGQVKVDQFTKRKFTWDWNTTSKSNNGSKVFMGSVSYGLVMALGDRFSSTRPYAAIRVGGSYIDYAVNVGLGRESGKTIGYNTNFEVGMIFNRNLAVSARYDLFSEKDGLNFNGWTLSAKYGLIRF